MLPLLFTDSIVVLITTLSLMAFGWLVWPPLFYAACAFLLFSFYFFRNPDRICSDALHNANIITAPADGRVIAVTKDVLDAQEYATRISIFLSLWDVHVNWTPIAGTIESISYRPGTFSLAYLPKSARENERNELVLLSDNGEKIMMRQIAGTVARRISCWVTLKEKVAVCQKVGIIRFGSRVDLFLPKNVRILVKEGKQVRGGETIVAEFT